MPKPLSKSGLPVSFDELASCPFPFGRALGLDRRDLFITTKLAPKDQGREAAEKAVKQALINLNTDYIDLFLIHWPGTQRLDPQDPSNQTLRTESWQVLEEYHKAGTLKAIGVSNFEIGHLKQLFQACQVQPHVNQIEVHPLFQNRDLTKFCQENNIHVTAYSSLGTTVSQNVLLSNDVVKLVADKANKTPAQILLKWATLKGYSVLPKSTNLDHILENISLDFKIPKEDLELLDGLEQDKKLTWNPKAVA